MALYLVNSGGLHNARRLHESKHTMGRDDVLFSPWREGRFARGEGRRDETAVGRSFRLTIKGCATI